MASALLIETPATSSRCRSVAVEAVSPLRRAVSSVWNCVELLERWELMVCFLSWKKGDGDFEGIE